MKTIKVRIEQTPVLVMNEDWEFVCPHESISIEDNSFDYAGTHCNGGVAGTETQYNAVCDDCDEDVSDSYDWESHYEEPDYDDRDY